MFTVRSLSPNLIISKRNLPYLESILAYPRVKHPTAPQDRWRLVSIPWLNLVAVHKMRGAKLVTSELSPDRGVKAMNTAEFRYDMGSKVDMNGSLG